MAKQVISANREDTKNKLIEVVIIMAKENQNIKEIFEDCGIQIIDIRKVLQEIFSVPPIIGMPIDSINQDLKDWADTIRNKIQLWKISKYTQIDNQDNVLYEMPEEFRPEIDLPKIEITHGDESLPKYYDITMADLIANGLVKVNELLTMTYGPRGSDKKEFIAKIQEGGTIKVFDREFTSPSFAALHCINTMGSQRTTVNGWTSWKNSNGQFLSELRDLYLQSR
jgi:hypothetical protein